MRCVWLQSFKALCLLPLKSERVHVLPCGLVHPLVAVSLATSFSTPDLGRILAQLLALHEEVCLEVDKQELIITFFLGRFG